MFARIPHFLLLLLISNYIPLLWGYTLNIISVFFNLLGLIWAPIRWIPEKPWCVSKTSASSSLVGESVFVDVRGWFLGFCSYLAPLKLLKTSNSQYQIIWFSFKHFKQCFCAFFQSTCVPDYSNFLMDRSPYFNAYFLSLFNFKFVFEWFSRTILAPLGLLFVYFSLSFTFNLLCLWTYSVSPVHRAGLVFKPDQLWFI